MELNRNGHVGTSTTISPTFFPELRAASAAERMIKILLVESNFDHVKIVDDALYGCLEKYTLTVAADGEEAMALFKPYARYGGKAKPDLILLEARLPRKDGYEVLFEIKADDRLAVIPVVVLSSSRDDEDIDVAYALGANCYVVKPSNTHDFLTTMRSVVNFWRTVAKLPNSSWDVIEDQLWLRKEL